MKVQSILPTLQRSVKKVSPLTPITRKQSAGIKQIEAVLPNKNVVSAFLTKDGSYGVGVSFADTGAGGMSGRINIDGELQPFHAQFEPGKRASYGEIVAILKDYKDGKCVDITDKVLSGKEW